MARKKSHPLKKKLFHLFKARGIMVLVFLVVSLVATVALVTNPNLSFDLRNWAAGNSCSEFEESKCTNTDGCTWNPEKITTSTTKGTCEGVGDCFEYRTKQSCNTYHNGCVWEFQKTTVPAFCSGNPTASPATNKTCPNADPYPPGKHGDVSWIGDTNYVCNGAIGDWISCKDKEALKNSPFGENFDCQSGGYTQTCKPNKCLDVNKLQTCTKTGVLPKYEIIDCSETGKVCSNAKCVDKVTCDGFPKCPGEPKIRSICKIVDNERVITPDPCLGDKVCSGEDGKAECLAPPPPPPTTYTCEDTEGQFLSDDMCECAGKGTHPQDQHCCKTCPTTTCTPNATSCETSSKQITCNKQGNGYTYQEPCECVNGACKTRTYDGNPLHRDLLPGKECDYNENKFLIGSTTWACEPKSPPKIPTGQKCTFNNNASCESGDCRYFANIGWFCWDSPPSLVCIPNITTCSLNKQKTCKADGTGYSSEKSCEIGCAGNVCNTICTPNTSTCSLNKQKTCNAEGSGYKTESCGYGCDGNVCRTTPIPNGQKCAGIKNNASCESGYCKFSIIPLGYYCRYKPPSTTCTASKLRCDSSNNILERCEYNEWVLRQDCNDLFQICRWDQDAGKYACKKCLDGEGAARRCTTEEMEDSKR